jgi:hypothetical protein
MGSSIMQLNNIPLQTCIFVLSSKSTSSKNLPFHPSPSVHVSGKFPGGYQIVT